MMKRVLLKSLFGVAGILFCLITYPSVAHAETLYVNEISETIDSSSQDAGGASLTGTSLTYSINNGILIISGTGGMSDTLDYHQLPWQNSSKNNIRIIRVNEGVTSISAYAFMEMTGVTEVSLPSSIQNIGSFAFDGCTNLKAVNIQNGKIGESAFINCYNLSDVTIGSGVTDIGVTCFEKCGSIRSVHISDVAKWCSIRFGGVYANPLEYANNSGNNAHLYINGSVQQTLTIPEGVSEISDFAFTDNRDVQTVNMPASLRRIGTSAFYMNTSLSTVNVPTNGLTYIGANAFSSDIALKNINIPGTVSYIGPYAFEADPITAARVEQGVIDQYAFKNCGMIGSFTIGNTVVIRKGAFEGCAGLKNAGELNASAKEKYQTVIFGGYKWLVLTVKDGKALLLSTDVQKFNSYQSSIYKDNLWSESLVRTWLNGTFLNRFNPNDRAILQTSTVSGTGNSIYGISDSSASQDAFFILSEDEISQYMPELGDRMANCTDEAFTDGGSTGELRTVNKQCWWWVRTPGMYSYSMEYVNYYGNIIKSGAANANSVFGIRPACWVNASSLGITGGGDSDRNTQQIKNFVTRLYQKCLGREPDADGLNDWTNRLSNGSISGVEAAKGFFLSEEMLNRHLSNSDYVETAYQVFFDRASDKDGKADWVDRLDSGMSYECIVHGFGESAEFQKVCDSYGVTRGTYQSGQYRDWNIGITKFVGRCYTKALGRPFDTDGLEYWCRDILTASNQRQEAIRVATDGFFHSEEFQNKNLSNEIFVKTLYETFLGRQYDKDGLEDWVNQLRNGASRDYVMHGFSDSQEFSNIMSSYGL